MKNVIKKVIAIVGPTATGKSDLAILLAQKFNGEIISADSRLVYKNFDIVSAKPTIKQMQGIKHHLIDVVEPTCDFNVADFCDLAREAIEKIIKKGKVPIIVGGTGLYFRILLEGYELPRVAPNFELRKKLEKMSSDELYEMLEKLDKKIVSNIHKNNRVKIIRAIEVSKALDEPMSKVQSVKKPCYDVLWIGLSAKNRQFIYNRADLRVEKMLESGLLDELKELLTCYGRIYAMEKTIGYSELLYFLDGKTNLETASDKIKQNTRRYAKRQLSWFRTNDKINWINIDENNNPEKLSSTLISEFLQKNETQQKILVHCCCAVCAGHPIEKLKQMGFEPILYFYNPNIYPLEEYQRRLAELKKFKNTQIIIEDNDFDNWQKVTEGLENEPEKGKRCDACFKLRLEKTAKTAKELGIKHFTTTLSVSPHKNFAKIFEIANSHAQKFDVKFMNIDFKKEEGFLKTTKIADEMGFYRQNYCGCLYSMDFPAYNKPKTPSPTI